MHLVMDMIFADSLEFDVSRETVISVGPSRSVEEHWKKLCAAVGIELLEYDTVQVVQNMETWSQHIELMGKLWVASKARKN